MLKSGNNIITSLKVGNTAIKAVYAGTVKIYPDGIRVDSGTVYGAWVYNNAIRTRTVTNWTQEIYQDGTRGPVVNTPAADQRETAVTSYRYGSWDYYSDNSYRQRSRTIVYTFTDTVRDGATDTVTENGTASYGNWVYNVATRTRTVTYTYSDTSKAAAPESETAQVSTDWDGVTYQNGACGSSYYYVDYKKVRSKYTFTDNVTYSDYRNGESRSRRLEGSCGWIRDWRLVSDWTNNGQTCNAAGVTNAYDCDGTYTVKYYQQERIRSYCFPDMSGETQRSTEQRSSGVQHSREQVDGCCGYVAIINNMLTLQNIELVVVEDEQGTHQEWSFDIIAQYPVDENIAVRLFTGSSNYEYVTMYSGSSTVSGRTFYGSPSIGGAIPNRTAKYNITY